MIKRIAFIIALTLTSIAGWAQAKYVFYFIGDGMGLGHVNATQYYNRMVLKNTNPILMMQFPVSGTAYTYSANAPVTDSAAAGTALATGGKTNNYMVGLAPDSITPYKSVASQLKERGYGVGILTSVSADDATPAAFYAHQKNRSMSREIDLEAAASGFDFIGGGNLRGLKDNADVAEAFKKAGYTIVRNPKAKEIKDADKLILLSPNDVGNIGYTIDSLSTLRLPEMMATALDFVSKKYPDGFFIMCEGGNIDHAAHANDGATVIKEILAFQDAIRHAYNFYLAHPDETLIVVTADHDTGGMTLQGGANLALADYQRMSKDEMSNYFRSIVKNNEPYTWDQAKQFLTEKLGFWQGVKVNDEQEKMLKEAFDATFVARTANDEKGLYNSFDQFVTKVFDVMNYRLGTAFTTRSHSANAVPVFAVGRGSYLFTGAINNTDIAPLILNASRK